MQAAEWSWNPTLSFWVDHDSNRNLVPEGTSTEGTAVSLDLQLRYATERLSLTLHPQAMLERFTGSAYPNSNDLSLATADSWLSERSTYSFTGAVGEQSLLTTELPVTGIVEPGTRRRDENATAAWTYGQTERWALTLQASYSDSVYTSDVAAVTPLQSFHGIGFSATEQLQYSDSLASFATASHSSYSLEEIPAPFRTDGGVVGLKWQIGERTSLSADAGVSRTTFESLTSRGFLGDFTLTRATESGSVSLNASRNVAPVGFGEITQQDVVRLSGQRDLQARLAVDANVSYFRYSSVFSIPGLITVDLNNLDRTYAQAAAGFTWRATETWSMALHGLASRLSGPTLPNAHDWQVRLQAIWAPFPHSLSR